mmetsp:Transcript_17290/g.46153  ORF Transcript_17290/g.46153 Transcript_17290/m.46153 type:complete len:130 (+) Transcript_17290:515-904(+)
MTTMQAEVAQKHGKMSSIFNYKSPAYPAEPQPINLTDGASPIEMAMATKQAEAIITHRIKMEEVKAKVFGDVMGGLSLFSIDAIQRTPGFDSLRTEGRPPRSRQADHHGAPDGWQHHAGSQQESRTRCV